MRLLIVEDESIIAEELKMQLEQLNYKDILIANSSKQAINKVKNNSVDLILMDINLGQSKNGIETIKEIKKSKNIPVLYLTGNKDEKTILEASTTYPIGYLTKPFNYEDIRSTLLLTTSKIIHPYVDIGENLSYDLKNKNLYYNGAFIKLSKNEKKLLEKLLDNKNSLVPYPLLIKEIFSKTPVYDEEDSLKRLIYRLRTKLRDRDLITTILSQGIKINI